MSAKTVYGNRGAAVRLVLNSLNSILVLKLKLISNFLYEEDYCSQQ